MKPSVRFFKKYAVTSHGTESPPEADGSRGSAPEGVGKKHARARERVERRADLLIQSRSRAKRIEHALHADIGGLLNGMAKMHDLSALQLLGLASELKRLLEEPATLAKLAVEGSRLYKEANKPTLSLTIVGNVLDKSAQAELREFGFTQTGAQWAGRANISAAISFARAKGVSLLRYDEDHTPRFYVRRGQDEPALQELLEEAKQQDAQIGSVLSSYVNLGLGVADCAVDDELLSSEPLMGTETVRVRDEDSRPAEVGPKADTTEPTLATPDQRVQPAPRRPNFPSPSRKMPAE